MVPIALLLAALAAAPDLPSEYYVRWLEEVEVLATPEEQRLFASLTRDEEREAFRRVTACYSTAARIGWRYGSSSPSPV